MPEPEGAAKYPPVAPWRRSGLDGSASRGNLVGLAKVGSGSVASDNDSDSGAQVTRSYSLLTIAEPHASIAREAPAALGPRHAVQLLLRRIDIEQNEWNSIQVAEVVLACIHHLIKTVNVLTHMLWAAT